VYSVLHITVHCGGGVGDTIFGLISQDKEFTHEIVILGYVLEKAEKKAQELDVKMHINLTHKLILKLIPHFDIILIHVWNHPLLYDFLIRNELPYSRVIMWGHNSGFHLPNVYPRKIFNYPDLFVFTTPLSYKLPELKDFPKEKLYDIWSTAGVDDFITIKKKEHKGFNIGYIGTVDYAKMHPDFLKICSKVKNSKVKFIVVGGTHEKEIEAQAREMGLNNIEFTGRVPYDKLKEYLSIFDVFAYPLAPYHYGTCDLVLQIAMASCLPIIVFNNPMEAYMIKNGYAGIGVYSVNAFVSAINILINSPELCKWYGGNAKNEAIERFSLHKLASEWNKVFNKVLQLPKKIRKWKLDITPKDVFLESLGDYGKYFEDKIKELAKDKSWQTETKGSVHNYCSYFPNDPILKKWSKIMKSELE